MIKISITLIFTGFLLFFIQTSCAQNQPGSGQNELEIAFPDLLFDRPVDLQNAGDGSNRLFVVEQSGIIHVFENNPTASTKNAFLDIRNKVDDSSNEEGLLGLAFHPNYKNNGFFYVNYTAASPNRTVIARYQVSAADSNVADPNSELVLMTIDKPFSNHNAGALTFGPNDGYLYITTGDGGSGGDPQGNGQNRQTLLGSILRIDVDNTDVGLNYAIPPDNPFVGNGSGFREEIYAYGMRNPWRISFDPVTGWLWAADVGQNTYEEVDIVEKGQNYGWKIMEGFHCFSPPSGCDMNGLTLPIWEYNHSIGQSITGGYVYRGSKVPELAGKYIYADFVSGRIWSLAYDGVNNAVNTELLNSTLNIASFGIDESRELYICAFDGRIYRFKSSVVGIPDQGSLLPQKFELRQNFPNPFNPATKIPFRLNEPARVSVRIFDVAGKYLHTLLDKFLPVGEHLVDWDGTDESGLAQSSGVYFYRMTVNREFAETQRMVLMR